MYEFISQLPCAFIEQQVSSEITNDVLSELLRGGFHLKAFLYRKENAKKLNDENLLMASKA